MQTTLKIKLKPNKEQQLLIASTMTEYIKTVNIIVDGFATNTTSLKITSKDADALLPSALRCQCVLDAKSVFKKYKQDVKKDANKKRPILKKPVSIWNNQNYKITESGISIPVLIQGKSKRIEVKAEIPYKSRERLISNKLGTLRISVCNGKLMAQIAIETSIEQCDGVTVMGVDLGIKVPAVAIAGNKARFFGNGRRNKYIRRHYKSRRRMLGKAKKPKAIVTLNNKEQRIMKDIDHKISREIVNFATHNGVGIIKLEQLTNIRKTTRTSRKNAHNLHTWSFYRLMSYITYKASLLGIAVETVNPAYTSQTCPVCGKRNHAKDRRYACVCGYRNHRDIVGAINISDAPVIVDIRRLA